MIGTCTQGPHSVYRWLGPCVATTGSKIRVTWQVCTPCEGWVERRDRVGRLYRLCCIQGIAVMVDLRQTKFNNKFNKCKIYLASLLTYLAVTVINRQLTL